jgi:hypothetical protein
LYPDFLFYLFDKPIQNQSEESIVFTFYERKKIIDFLDELGLFIEEKPICTKKKIRHYAVCRHLMTVQMKILSARFWKDAFKLETSPFGSLKILV